MCFAKHYFLKLNKKRTNELQIQKQRYFPHFTHVPSMAKQTNQENMIETQIDFLFRAVKKMYLGFYLDQSRILYLK